MIEPTVDYCYLVFSGIIDRRFASNFQCSTIEHFGIMHFMLNQDNQFSILQEQNPIFAQLVISLNLVLVGLRLGLKNCQVDEKWVSDDC
jgi:lipoprotein signal peptidase